MLKIGKRGDEKEERKKGEEILISDAVLKA